MGPMPLESFHATERRHEEAHSLMQYDRYRPGGGGGLAYARDGNLLNLSLNFPQRAPLHT